MSKEKKKPVGSSNVAEIRPEDNNWMSFMAKTILAVMAMGLISIATSSLSSKSFVKDYIVLELRPYNKRLRRVETAQMALEIHTCYTARGVARLLNEKAPDCRKDMEKLRNENP